MPVTNRLGITRHASRSIEDSSRRLSSGNYRQSNQLGASSDDFVTKLVELHKHADHRPGDATPLVINSNVIKAWRTEIYDLLQLQIRLTCYQAMVCKPVAAICHVIPITWSITHHIPILEAHIGNCWPINHVIHKGRVTWPAPPKSILGNFQFFMLHLNIT